MHFTATITFVLSHNLPCNVTCHPHSHSPAIHSPPATRHAPVCAPPTAHRPPSAGSHTWILCRQSPDARRPGRTADQSSAYPSELCVCEASGLRSCGFALLVPPLPLALAAVGSVSAASSASSLLPSMSLTCE